VHQWAGPLIGRRVGSVGEIERAGDYAYAENFTGGKPAVFFLLPNAEGPNPLRRSPEQPANGLHHVTSPPHTFRHCADGSIEIRASIGAHAWHGWLDEGHVWREA
jgi:hypothetical protein